MARVVEGPLTLDTLLSMSCPNPEDWKDYEKWSQEDRDRRNTPGYSEKDYVPYNGWMRYNVTVHCVTVTIVARLKEDGTYEIQKYLLEDH